MSHESLTYTNMIPLDGIEGVQPPSPPETMAEAVEAFTDYAKVAGESDFSLYAIQTIFEAFDAEIDRYTPEQLETMLGTFGRIGGLATSMSCQLKLAQQGNERLGD